MTKTIRVSLPEEKTPKNFYQKIYDLTAAIPKGCVASYGQLALLADAPRNARTVGYVMSGVPNDSPLPCHRVVYKDGSMAPEYAFGDSDIQREMLMREGVTILANGKVDMDKCRWKVIPQKTL